MTEGLDRTIAPSVVVRARDKIDTIEATIDSLRGQSVACEIVLVDSGSTDGTLERAGPRCDRVVQLAPARFSYGHALNLGAGAANGQIVFALSAHCAPRRADWIERSLAHYRDPSVAGTCGERLDPSGAPLAAPCLADLAMALANPYWGYSCHACSWRRDVWRAFPFDEDMASCEDKDWSWRVLAAGRTVAVDPALVVDGGHRRAAGIRTLATRVYRESAAVSEHLEYPTWSLAELGRHWWGDFAYPSRYPDGMRRLGPMRTVELGARWAGEQSGRRRRGPHTVRP